MLRLGTTLLGILALPSLRAQSSAVLPPSHAALEGTGFTNVPFGRSTSMRAQLAYDASLFPGALTFDALGVRLEGGQTAAGKRIELEIRASTLPWRITAVQSAFDVNRGSDETVVLSRTLVDLPPSSAGQTPNPFHAEFAFERPFRHDPARGGLLLDLLVFGQPPGAFTLDSTYTCQSARVDFGAPGCSPHGGGRALAAEVSTQQVMWGRPLTLRVFDGPPLVLTLLSLGTIEAGSWFGLPIPLDLSPFGAPGCTLSIDMAQVLAQRADVAGAAEYTLVVPSEPGLTGQWLRYQGFAVDPSLNALGAISSRAGKVQVCGWEPVARVYGSPVTVADGFREIGVAPVVRLRVP
jgi:hypothetical protein